MILLARSAHWRGDPITLSGDEYVYDDTGERVRDNPNRPCAHCSLANTTEGHDGCLGTIPAALNACCGHGDERQAYVQFPERVLRGSDALDFFALLKSQEDGAA